jgi:hypothetical protein
MLDPLGKLLIELRDDVEVDAIVDGRVRGNEPKAGDAQPLGDYQAFVVITELASPRIPRVPVQRVRYGVRCYGRTFQEARSLYGACSDAIHLLGPRLHANGLGIYISIDDTGGTASRDPDTKQPLVDFVIELLATTQAVAV